MYANNTIEHRVAQSHIVGTIQMHMFIMQSPVTLRMHRPELCVFIPTSNSCQYVIFWSLLEINNSYQWTDKPVALYCGPVPVES